MERGLESRFLRAASKYLAYKKVADHLLVCEPAKERLKALKRWKLERGPESSLPRAASKYLAYKKVPDQLLVCGPATLAFRIDIGPTFINFELFPGPTFLLEST